MEKEIVKTQLRVALVQLNIIWEDSVANLAKLDELLSGIEADLIVLPEMFNTGFSMQVEKISQEPYGNAFQWMQKKSKELNAAITGSISTSESEHYYNRLYFVTPGGSIYQYDKKHLFSYGTEPNFYSAGNRTIAIEYLGWKIRPVICYDLRFPVWLRNDNNYDLLLVVANWPAARKLAWETLLQARAIENMAYVAGVNRIGIDGSNLEYQKSTHLFDALGQDLKAEYKNEEVLQFTIDQNQLKAERNKFRFLNDRDEFTIKP